MNSKKKTKKKTHHMCNKASLPFCTYDPKKMFVIGHDNFFFTQLLLFFLLPSVSSLSLPPLLSHPFVLGMVNK